VNSTVNWERHAKFFWDFVWSAAHFLCAEEASQAAGEMGEVADLAFPEGEGAVAEVVELAEGAAVAGLVAAEFGEPVGAAGGRGR
jgi:hypothetical protein